MTNKKRPPTRARGFVPANSKRGRQIAAMSSTTPISKMIPADIAEWNEKVGLAKEAKLDRKLAKGLK